LKRFEFPTVKYSWFWIADDFDSSHCAWFYFMEVNPVFVTNLFHHTWLGRF
jgi:hypothetical protein